MPSSSEPDNRATAQEDQAIYYEYQESQLEDALPSDYKQESQIVSPLHRSTYDDQESQMVSPPYQPVYYDQAIRLDPLHHEPQAMPSSAPGQLPTHGEGDLRSDDPIEDSPSRDSHRDSITSRVCETQFIDVVPETQQDSLQSRVSETQFIDIVPETQQDSLQSRVGETQFIDVVPETQQDSLQSRVEDTQFVRLAFDTQTQPSVEFPIPSGSQREFQNKEVRARVLDPLASSSTTSNPLFERPREPMEDLQESFRFGKHSKPVAGQYNRAIGRSSSGSVPRPKPPDLPQTILTTEHHEDSALNILAVTRNDSADAQDPSPGIENTKHMSRIEESASELSYERHAPPVSSNRINSSSQKTCSRSVSQTAITSTAANTQPPPTVPQEFVSSQEERHLPSGQPHLPEYTKLDDAEVGRQYTQPHRDAIDHSQPYPQLSNTQLRSDCSLLQSTAVRQVHHDENRSMSSRANMNYNLAEQPSSNEEQDAFRGKTHHIQTSEQNICHDSKSTPNAIRSPAKIAPPPQQSTRQLPTPRRSPSNQKQPQRNSKRIKQPFPEVALESNLCRVRQGESRAPRTNVTNSGLSGFSTNTQNLQESKPVPSSDVCPENSASMPSLPKREFNIWDKKGQDEIQAESNNTSTGVIIHKNNCGHVDPANQLHHVPTTNRIYEFDNVDDEHRNPLPLTSDTGGESGEDSADIVQNNTAPRSISLEEHLETQEWLYEPEMHLPLKVHHFQAPADLSTPQTDDPRSQTPSQAPYRAVSQVLSRPLSRIAFRAPSRGASLPTSRKTTTLSSGVRKPENRPAAAPSWGSPSEFKLLNADLERHIQDRCRTDQEFWAECLEKNNLASDTIENQKAEIEKLKGSKLDYEKLIRALEGEKKKLKEKVQGLKTKSKKYTVHMNEVLTQQQHLQELKIENAAAVNGVRAIQKSTAEHDILIKEQEQKTLDLQKRVKEALQDASTQLDYLTKTNDLLKEDLDRRLIELGREKNLSLMLQKQLDDRKAEHEEFVELLTKAQSDTIKELTKEDGVLANILNSERSTQPKIDELLTMVNVLKSNEPDLSPALLKLLEDSFTRVDSKLQASSEVATGARRSELKLLSELKEDLSKLRLDQEEKTPLQDRITELQATNATLNSSIVARGHELDGLKTQIKNLGKELANCSSELTEKGKELEAVLARPQEDLSLNVQLHEFERANTSLQDQVDAANREVMQVKEELRLLQEASQVTQEQMKEAKGKLTKAEAKIRNFVAEKKLITERSKQESDRSVREFARKVNDQKEEMKRRYEAMAKTQKQLRADLESQINKTNKTLQEKEEALSRHTNDSIIVSNLRAEIASCKEMLLQERQHITTLEAQCTVRAENDGKFELGYQDLRNEVQELKNFLKDSKSTASLIFEVTQRERRQIEDEFRHIKALQKDKELMEQNKSAIQDKLDSLNKNLVRHLRHEGMLLEGQTVEEWAASVPLNTPPRDSISAMPLSENSGPPQMYHTAVQSSLSTPHPSEQTASNSNQVADRLSDPSVVDRISSYFDTHGSQNFSRSGADPANVTRARNPKGTVSDVSRPAVILSQTLLSPGQMQLPRKPSRRVASRGRAITQNQSDDPDHGILRTETEISYLSRTTAYKEEREAVQPETWGAGNATPTSILPFSTMTPVANPALEKFDFLNSQDDIYIGYGRSPGGKSTRHKPRTANKLRPEAAESASYKVQPSDHMTTAQSWEPPMTQIDEPRRRSQLIPRKSAMKKHDLVKDTNKLAKQAAFASPHNRSPTPNNNLLNQASIPGIGKNLTRSSSSSSMVERGGKSYCRPIFGSKPSTVSSGARHQVTGQYQSADARQTQIPLHSESPMAAIPNRFLKRMEAGGMQPESPSKIRRLSMPFPRSIEHQASTSEIPDSQEKHLL